MSAKFDWVPQVAPDAKRWRENRERLRTGAGAHMSAELVARGWIATSNVHARGWRHPTTGRHYTMTQAYAIATSVVPSRADMLTAGGWRFNAMAPKVWAWSHPDRPGKHYQLCDAWKHYQRALVANDAT